MRLASVCLLVAGLAASALAEVVTDGTVGPCVRLGGDFEIGADLGTRAGRKLFHSFEKFSLATGERATFSGPDEVRNVISQVTGGARSDIAGRRWRHPVSARSDGCQGAMVARALIELGSTCRG